jgi:hypothetical protein
VSGRNVDNRLRKRLGRLLWQVVADAARDRAVAYLPTNFFAYTDG